MSKELAEAPDDAPQEQEGGRRRTSRSVRPRSRRGKASRDQQEESDKQSDAPVPEAAPDRRRTAEAGPRAGTAAPAEGRSSRAGDRKGDESPETQASGTAEAKADESGAAQAGTGQDKRRQRRRPSRSRSKPPQPHEPQPGQPAEPGSTAETSAQPPVAEAGTREAPAPVVTEPPGEGQRTRLAKRRRRGGPKRVRDTAVQAEAGPLTMLITVGEERNQIAVLRNRELIEHYVSHDEDRSIVGNIYVGRVQNVLPGMEAAFLDIGEARNAVLYAGEVSFDEEIEGPPPRIESMLKSGQAVLAQVTKDPMGSKGARLTTEVSLAGRYVVLVPGADSMGISRRLPDEERRRLREIAGRVRPRGHGLIVRTAAEGVSDLDLEGDVKRLVRIWSEIEQKRKTAKPPKLVYSEPDLAIRGIRDLFTADVLRVIVDDRTVFGQVRDYLTEVAPVLAERVELYEDPQPLFHKFGVVEQLRKAIDRKVWLKSGGHIVIDRTEAMTVIDVNTGRFVGKSNLETTVLHANLEAAEEIAKQLRLRDIGGIIVIDFIDMMHERNRQELVRTFEAALQRDKTRTQVFSISELGLLQMTRKNVSEGLMEAFSQVCETCQGRGIILSDLE